MRCRTRLKLATPRDTARVMGEVATELARREAAGDEDAPPIYLVIFNGGRFRDLRRGEDDFSFSTDRDKPPSPDKQWAEILRNGPAWGVHSLVWCDSYNNVSRILDRMAMREFEMRIAFQMSAADSSSLLDNPAAAKLRQHRGLFASEDLGTLEKFRPYGIPTDAWLAEVRQAAQALVRRVWVTPVQTRKQGVVAVGADPLAARLNGERRKIGVGHEISLGRYLAAQITKNVPMPRAGLHQYTVRLFAHLVGELQCLFDR